MIIYKRYNKIDPFPFKKKKKNNDSADKKANVQLNQVYINTYISLILMMVIHIILELLGFFVTNQ